jgi:hypothetical protein
MKSDVEPICVDGVRFYLTPEKLLSLESPVLTGVELRVALFPKLMVAVRTFRNFTADWSRLEEEAAAVFRNHLAGIAASPDTAMLRGRCHEVAAVVPDFPTTCRMAWYRGCPFPQAGIPGEPCRSGNNLETVPGELYESFEMVVPFSYSLLACLPKT